MIQKPEMDNDALNNACWEFIHQMKLKDLNMTPALWNNLKPMLHSVICKYIDEVNKMENAGV